MSYDLVIAGTQRFTTQGYLPTGTAVRIYEVFLVTSAANQSIYFSDNAPTTTATNTANQKLFVPVTDSTTTYFIGTYSNVMGIRFDNSALLHSCSGIHFAVVNFVTEK